MEIYGPSSARLTGNWTSPIYALFGPVPDITYDAKGRRAHEFRCTATYCKGKRIVRRFLDTTDRKSTSNLKRHATVCWGSDVVGDALEARGDLKSTRKTLNRQHTKAETR